MISPVSPVISLGTTKARSLVFLLFLFITMVGEAFIENSFKFAAFGMTGSQSALSLVGSISAVAFITLGLFSGVIVDAVSRKLFIYFHLSAIAALSLLFFLIYRTGHVGIVSLFGFILMHEMSAAFAGASRNSVFYDLCGTDHLASWISRRSMAITAATMSSSLILVFFVGDPTLLFLIYSLLLLIALLVFRLLRYEDQNQRQDFDSLRKALTYIVVRLKDFMGICLSNNALLFLFLFSFMKTAFIFWPMASGALLKFGVEDPASRQVYLIASVIMSIVSMTSLYAIGWKTHFTNQSFVAGAGISGLGIFLFSLFDDTLLSIFMLAIMYVGLAISQVSSSYVLRMELPEDHRTQGLAFAVVPYYLADLVSGVIYALLLVAFDVDTLLLWTGALLTLLSVASLRLLKPRPAAELVANPPS